MDEVFKALADPTRRRLLDQLFREDGQTLSALEGRFKMTRFGIQRSSAEAVICDAVGEREGENAVNAGLNAVQHLASRRHGQATSPTTPPAQRDAPHAARPSRAST